MTDLAQLPLFGRRYNVAVALPSSGGGAAQEVITVTDSSFEPEALRVTFDIRTYFFQTFWYATVVIYNLDQQTTQKLISGAGAQGGGQAALQTPVKQGMSVSISAGYLNGNYGEIWNGPVFQALFERENVTDFKITLHCILGLDELSRTAVSSVYSALTNQTQIIQKIAAAAFIPVSGGAISSKLKPAGLPRSKTVFGPPSKYFTEVADDNNMQWFLTRKGLTLARIDEDIVSSDPILVFTPDTGLIGTPQQTQYGVAFRVLLDPRVQVQRPAMQVNIDNSAIILQKKQVGSLPSILDQNGTYIVFGARYFGDTRGQEWYTDIDGLTSVNGKMAMAQLLTANASLNR